ncbi:hypothetical protein [Acinetobacter sp. YH12157]|uniref:hypothetical protein n=1 Tax=Acinetobacter sp. YH12157 TaxID=2601137 RepID=UPI0015D3F85A|nr:hypothetical protein [Acinetobacter sp. YH12157]
MYQASKKNILQIIGAIFIALIICIFPWESVRNYEFVDLSRNILKYEYPNYYFDYDFSNNKVAVILKEPFWYYINISFKSIGFSAEFFFTLLSFFSLFIITKYLLSNNVRFAYILFLINPVFLDFVLSQQRNALVFSVFMLILSFRSKVLKLFFLLLPLIHSLSVFLIVIYFLHNYIIETYNSIFKKKIVVDIFLLVFSLSLSLIMVFGRSYLSGFSDDNRLGEYEVVVNSTLYILPWIFYLYFLVFFTKEVSKNYIYMFLFLSMYIWLTIFEFYAIRFLAMSMPFFIIILSKFRYRAILSLLFSIHQLILLFYWLKLG